MNIENVSEMTYTVSSGTLNSSIPYLLWLECRQEMSASLISAVVSNALFHSNSHINLIPPQIIHILHFFW